MKLPIALVLMTGLSCFGSVVSAQTTLAEASEAAKKIQHEWPLSTNIKVYTNADLPVTVPGQAAVQNDGAVPIVAPTTAPALTVKDGEAYWRGRMEALQGRLQDDTQALVRLTARIADLSARAAQVVDANRLRDGRATLYGQTAASPAVTEVMRLETEQDVLTATVAADTEAIAALQEEARHAGALPGWLR